MCDTMIAGREITRCGYSIFGKASDRSVNEPQYFVFVPAADHAAGSTVKTTCIGVEQAPHTHAMILSKPSWIWGAEMGVNEKGVVIGNEAVHTRETRREGEGLRGMDLLRLCLERAESAAQAVEVLCALLERYGQGGNCSFDGVSYYDNSFLIADANETWHVETAARYWAAKRVQGGYSISNYPGISRADRLQKDAIRNAQEKGYPTEEPFDWLKAYTDWSAAGSVSGLVRRACSYQQMNRCGRQFEVADMLCALRTHYSDDEWTNGRQCVCMHASPQDLSYIGSQTANCMGAVLDPADMLLFGSGMSTTCIAPIQPFWFDAYADQLVFAYDRQEEAVAHWLERERLHRTVLQGRLPLKDYQQELHAMEKRWFAAAGTASKSDRQALVDANAAEAEAFISKWLRIAEKEAPHPIGSMGFQAWWQVKNELLGRDRRIAY